MATESDHAQTSKSPYMKSRPRWDYSILNEDEIFWRDHQKWLEQHGYMLRPRFHPGWVPKWEGTKVNVLEFEDAMPNKVSSIGTSFGQARLTDRWFSQYHYLIDATKIRTSEMVMLKRISVTKHPTEVDINRFFATEPQSSDPRNHSIPLYDVLQVPDDPDTVILVFPFLRPLDCPEFETVGEAVEFFRQIFEVSFP